MVEAWPFTPSQTNQEPTYSRFFFSPSRSDRIILYEAGGASNQNKIWKVEESNDRRRLGRTWQRNISENKRVPVPPYNRIAG